MTVCFWHFEQVLFHLTFIISHKKKKILYSTSLLNYYTQLIQYVLIRDKNPVTSWQCFEKHIFNTDSLSAKLQQRTPVLTALLALFTLARIACLWHLCVKTSRSITLFGPRPNKNWQNTGDWNQKNKCQKLQDQQNHVCLHCQIWKKKRNLIFPHLRILLPFSKKSH